VQALIETGFPGEEIVIVKPPSQVSLIIIGTILLGGF